MQIIANRMIDLADYEPSDLIINYPRANRLGIQTDGTAKLTVQGHNVLADTYYTLPIVETSSYDVLTEITKAGVYEVDISAVDVVKVVPSENKGTIYLKVSSEGVISGDKTEGSTGGDGEGTNNYNELTNKPSINGNTLEGNLTAETLGLQPKGDYALKSEIPTKTSKLINDSGYIENDASGEMSLAIGQNASATHFGGTAIGDNSSVLNDYAVAIGTSSHAMYDYSIIIGNNGSTTKEHQFVVGGNDGECYINEMALSTENGLKVVAFKEDVDNQIGDINAILATLTTVEDGE